MMKTKLGKSMWSIFSKAFRTAVMETGRVTASTAIVLTAGVFCNAARERIKRPTFPTFFYYNPKAKNSEIEDKTNYIKPE